MTSKHLIISLLFLASVSVLAVTAQQNNAPADKPSTSSDKHKRIVQTQDEGERVFQEHCSRCHGAPEGFSPRISGTIVRHMRVRASLSQHEEEVLRSFFNP
jgi:cytochrome c5